MYKTTKEIGGFISDIENSGNVSAKIKVVVCPSFPSISIANQNAKKIKIGAQKCFYKQIGAFTGDVSPKSLYEAGARYVIIGHSERRIHHKETDLIINEKVKLATRSKLRVILCVGETRSIRLLGTTKHYIQRQLSDDLNGLSKDYAKDLIIAYEPIWAISGFAGAQSDTPEDAFVIARIIKEFLEERFGSKIGSKIPVIYGGSVTESNAKKFVADKSISGLLIGKSSADAKTFVNLLESLR